MRAFVVIALVVLVGLAATSCTASSSSSAAQFRTSTGAWTCCRVCPQHHLLEMDQMFGSVPPSRRYDEQDEVPQSRSFLHMAAAVAAKKGPRDAECCNVCPTGLSPGFIPVGGPAPPAAPVGASGVRREGISAPLANLQFNMGRIPLPPCCPYCREQHMDEPFSDVVKQDKTRALPARSRRMVASHKARQAALLEMETGVKAAREYLFEPATPDNCCSRCLRAPGADDSASWPADPVEPEDVLPIDDPGQKGPEPVPDCKEDPPAPEPEPEPAVDPESIPVCTKD